MSSKFLPYFNQDRNIRLRKILFSLRDDWRQSIICNVDQSKYEIIFSLFDDNLNFNEFDLIIPLTIKDQLFLNERRNILPKNFFVPSSEAISLADNKYEFNKFLYNNFLEQYLPPPLIPGHYPYILKKKISGFGKDCYIISNEKEELRFSELIDDKENYFVQSIISGEKEYTTHIFFYEKIVFHITYQFVYPHPIFIKGCNCVGKSSRKITTPFLEIWNEILSMIKYEGMGCFNYKIKDNQPVIFEFNPRFGSSLTQEVSSVINNQFKIFNSL
jgi:hypothetical protein